MSNVMILYGKSEIYLYIDKFTPQKAQKSCKSAKNNIFCVFFAGITA